MDGTDAKIGRSMKKRENIVASLLDRVGVLARRAGGFARGRFAARLVVVFWGSAAAAGGNGGGRRGHRLRLHLRARPGPQQSVHDDQFVGFKPGFDRPHAIQQTADLNGAVLHHVVLVHRQQILLPLIGANRSLADQRA